MTASADTATKNDSEWLSRVRDAFEPIGEVVKALPNDLKPYSKETYLELLRATIQDARAGAVRALGPVGAAASAMSGEPIFQKFIGDYQFSIDALSHVVDLESSTVLARTPASTKSESQRRIAALLALSNAHKTGEFSVSREKLVDACKGHGVYDSANFAANMDYTFKGSTVFTRDPDGTYKISRPGEGYVAEVVRSLLGASEGGVPA